MTAGPVLAIDVGTSSVRVAVITPDATVLDLIRSDRAGADPGHAFDADTLWSSIVVAVAALDARARNSCTAVSVAAHLGTVLLDQQLRTVGPASGWSDPRGTSALAAALGDDTAALLRATGRPVVSAGPLAALLDARRDPGTGVSLAVSPKDFVVARLSAERPVEVVTDTTSAAYTGALDVRSRAWSRAVLDRVDVDAACLGRVVEPLDVVGELRDDVARAMGLPPRLPVVGGGPDGTIGLTLLLGTIDTGAPSGDGPVGDVAGTTDVLAVRRDTFPDVGPAAVVNPFPLGGWTVGGPTGTTGGAVAHWARVLGFPDTAAALAALGAEVGRIPPGSAGLTAEVAMSGRRFPHWDSGPGAGLSGMTDAHGPAHVLRAVIEGGARAVADAVAAMPVGADTPLVLAGGAARSLAVVRIRADVLGRSVMACDEPDMTLKGAALVGVLGAGGTEERSAVLTTFAPSGTIVDPGRCTPLDQDREPSVAVSWQPNTANPSSPMRLPASNTTARTT